MPNSTSAIIDNNTLLDILTLSKDATAIYSDVDLNIKFANDAMIALWGKDRTVINKRLADAVPELKGQPFVEMLQQVWRSGKTIADSDTEAMLEVDGKLQSFYFDFEYRALLNDEGQTYAILHTATDVTERFKAWKLVEEKQQREQQLITDLTIANQDHQSINEELNSLNEEYQTTNEELTAVNEEYHTANEQLAILNKEVETTIVQLNLARKAAGIGVFDLDVENDLLYWDERCRELFGVDENKNVAYSAEFVNGLHPDDKEKTLAAVSAAYDQELTGGAYDVEYRTIAADSSKRIRHLRAVGQVYFTNDAKPQRFIGTVVDVTETVEARTKLEESEQKLQDYNEELTALNEELSAVNEEYQATNEELLSLNEEYQVTNEELRQVQEERQVLYDEMTIREARLELAADIVLLATIDIDLLTDELTCSQRYAELFGFSSATGLTQKDFFNLIHPDDDREIVQPAMKQAYITGEFSYQARLIVTGQPLKWINVKGRLIHDREGQPVRIVSTAKDVTVTLMAEKLIADAEERLRFALDASELGAWDLDIKNNLVIWDDRCKELYGFAKDDVVPYEEVLRYMHPEDRLKVNEAVLFALDPKSGGYYDIEFRTIGAEDSEVRWLHCRGKALFDSDGVAYRFTGIAQDITESYLLQQEIEIAKDNLEFAIEAANFGTWHINAKTRNLVANARLKELFGFYPDEEVTVADCIAQITEDYRESVAKAIESAIVSGGDYDLSYTVRGKRDDLIRWVRAVGTLKVDFSGELTAFTGVIMDITEQKQDEQRKNDFVGMVSHELRSPLTSLNGYIQMLQLRAKKAEDIATSGITEKAQRQVNKMRTLITGFLDMARIDSGKIHLERKCFDIAELIKDAEEESLATITSHTVLFEPVNHISIFADRDKISQVVTNFINNAVKYSPHETTIKVACVAKDDFVLVSVKDEGMGLTDKDKAYVFDRFYRVENEAMKATNGFGIGLYLCAEIINRHEGNIGVDSEIGKGSTFWFSLKMLSTKDQAKLC